MTQDIFHAFFNGVSVTVGLFVLWSFVGRMRHVEATTRFGWALVAGVISTVAAFILRLII